jgi:hypothetical protein
MAADLYHGVRVDDAAYGTSQCNETRIIDQNHPARLVERVQSILTLRNIEGTIAGGRDNRRENELIKN